MSRENNNSGDVGIWGWGMVGGGDKFDNNLFGDGDGWGVMKMSTTMDSNMGNDDNNISQIVVIHPIRVSFILWYYMLVRG
jgi:hypothetical protein